MPTFVTTIDNDNPKRTLTYEEQVEVADWFDANEEEPLEPNVIRFAEQFNCTHISIYHAISRRMLHQI